ATVRAPFGGVILEVTTEIGQFVGAGTQVATMVDVDAMEVEANVPSRFVDALQQGLEVSARGDSGRTLPLVLRAILPTEFSSTRTRPVRFDIADNTGGQVAVGQAVTLQVPISAPRDVTVVPKDALVQGRGGGWMVFLNLEGKATPRPVEIGAALEGGFEVLSGLQPGDEVVVRGNERLRPGQDIQPMNAGTPPGGSQGGQRGEPAAGSGETAGRQRAQATN
ncbi:MAG: efflux RND transporter periplasmic adaptor subunit, partial [Pseudomonadota bacterium]